jgi:O-antigen/teichoic acid export membrane protein
LVVVSVIGIAMITYTLGAMVPSLHLGASTEPLLLAIIGFQLQDWLRRVLYAQHKTSWVLVLDMMAYGGQFLCLIVLYYQKTLTPATALLAMGGAFFISALIILTLQKVTPNFSHAIEVVKLHWRGSRDYFIAWQLQWAGSQGLALFGGGVLGPQVVGALRASINLVAPINVLFQWMDNVIPVRAVNHLKSGGLAGMNKFLSHIALVGGVLFGLMAIILYFFSEPLLALLYGESYRPYAFFVFLQAIFLWLNHFYRIEFFACRATNRTADIARASFIMALGSILTGIFSVYWVGGSGVILALILGQSISHAYLFYRRKITQKSLTY